LLLLHGWPGSFIEFQKSIPLLTDPKNSDVNFELIIASLPGYGFSDGAAVPGLGPVEMAQVFDMLMKRLGHDKYYTQGGDWGAIITSNMAALYPKRVRGLHSNMCIPAGGKSTIKLMLGSLYPSLFMSPEEASVTYAKDGEQGRFSTILEESGYMHLQATKPDTAGVGLSNSPSGLAAYIIEKFSTWTNKDWRSKPDGGLESYYKLDELLDNVMVYWVTNSITTSMRLYSEAFSYRQLAHQIDQVPIDIPSACIQAPKEAFGGSPRWILEDRYRNLKSNTIAPKGGHFLAFEAPEIITNDMIKFFNTLEKSGSF